MESRPLARWIALAVMCAVVVGCASAAAGRGGGSDEPRAVISQVSGSLQVTNSRSGQAIFEAQGLAPGRSVTGTVQLSNTGTLAGDLSLAQVDVLDQPGANGGLLSNGVHLDIQDVTGGGAIPVFAGPLATVGTRPLGSLGAGQARIYRFTASLPDTGAPLGPTLGDNAYKGSRVSVRYTWTATAPDGTGGGGTGGGGGGTGGGTGGTPLTVKIMVVSKKLLKRGVLDVMTTCSRACRVTAFAQLPKAKGARRAARTRSRSATLMTPNKAGRIRLKLSRKGKRQLLAALRKKRRVVLRVNLSVSAASGGPVTRYSRKVVVKRPKPRRSR